MTKTLLAALATLTACQIPSLELHTSRIGGESSHRTASSPQPASSDSHDAQHTKPAPDEPTPHRISGRLDSYKDRVSRMASSGEDRGNESQYTSEECWKLAKADGTPEALKICTELDGQTKLRPLRKGFDRYAFDLMTVNENFAGPDEKSIGMLAESQKTCYADIDHALADGVPADLTFYVQQAGDMTLAKMRTDVCAKFDAAVKKMAADVADENARIAKVAAPYKAAGAGGERLDFLVKYDSVTLYGAGGKALRTPREAARAQVLFYGLGGQGGTTILRRIEFSGNTIAYTSQHEYIEWPGAAAFK